MENNQISEKKETNNKTFKNESSKFYGQTINAIDTKPLNLETFKGKPVLLVNIATQCGYTGQLGGLEDLYKSYKDKGLTVIGIPSNDFGGQTPEKASAVKDFCKLNYGVTFPLTEKTEIKSPDEGSLAYWLTKSSENKSSVKWNFEKFLVNKEGRLIKRYASSVKPDDSELISDIEGTL